MQRFVRRFVSAVVTFSLLMFISTTQVEAGHGFFGGYIGIDTGSGNTFFGLTQPGPATVTPFDGLSLGVVTSLTLSGGEGLTFKDSGDNVTGVNVNYVVYPTATPSSIFSFKELFFTADQPFNDAAGNPFSTTGDQKWGNIASTPNLLTGLTPGDYTLEVFLSGFGKNAAGAEEDFFLRHGEGQTLDYFATFTVAAVPEPTTALLVGLSLTGAAFLRRRRS